MPAPAIQHPNQGCVEAGLEHGRKVLLTVAEGRGFTTSELKLAGIRKKEAKGLGIVFDHRRRSKSEEGQSLNVERLKEYRSRLVVFPRKAGKPKSGDAQVRRAVVAGSRTDSQGEDLTAHITRALPALPASYTAEAPRAITSEEKEFNAFRAHREARAEKRNLGGKIKRAEAKAAEEAAKK